MGEPSRAGERDLEWLIERPRTAYEILGVEEGETSVAAIRRAYRRKALVLHPDKNKAANAEEQFHEVWVSNRVLCDVELRRRYDEHLGRKQQQKKKVRKVDTEKQDRLREGVLQREREHLQNQKRQETRDQKLRELHEEFQRYKRSKMGDNEEGSGTTRVVRVKWKHRKELSGFNEEVIAKLMGVFGEVETVTMSSSNKPKNRYYHADVIYKSPVGAALASVHDYSKTDSLWDELGIHRLASLLRGAKLVDFKEQPPNTLEDYIAQSTVKIAGQLLNT